MALQLTDIQQQVLDAFRAHGPMTDATLVQKSGIDMRTASPRRRGLADRGLLEVVGEEETSPGRKSKLWGLVPEERISEVRDRASQRNKRRKTIHDYKLPDRIEMAKQLLDDKEVNAALRALDGPRTGHVRGRARERATQMEHERRMVAKQIREAQEDPTGMVEFLKCKRNLLNVTEALRGTSEFAQDEMANRAESGNLRIPEGAWPEVVSLIEDLEEMAREAREAINDVMGLGDLEVIEVDADEYTDLDLPMGDADVVG